MKASWRRDLADHLAHFVAVHPGTRSGRMFGWPAAYAGRRLFSFAVEDGIIAKLPPDAMAAARAKGAKPWTPRGRPAAKRSKQPKAEWVVFTPKDARAAEAINPFLEIAARYVVNPQ
jgi:hypothetical protein